MRGAMTCLFLFIIPRVCITAGEIGPFGYASDTTSILASAQAPDKSRLRIVNYTTGGLYVLSMSWLYTQWYRDYPHSEFHFFNDNSEWLQIDKYAHTWTAYNVAKPLMHCYRWAGYDNMKSTLYGTGVALLYQTTIEVFDGFSAEWGFSGGDMLANAVGAGFFVFQQLHWKEQRIVLKFSYHESAFPKYRSDVLGETFPERLLKDYNGQTYWITFNPRAFRKSSAFPNWFSLAIGFGGEGMTGGKDNPALIDGEAIPDFERFRQFYFSIDIDLARVRTKSQFLESLFKLINVIHLPAPAIEFSPGRKVKFHSLYF